MTDSASPIWREDEGRASEPTALSTRSTPDLFGPARPVEPETATHEPVDLWRSDEGRPSHQVRLRPASETAPTEPRRRRQKPEKRGLISWRVVIVTAVMVLLLALVVDGGLGLLTIRGGLERAADRLEDVESLLADGDLGGAAGSADDARAEAVSAEDATKRPSLFLASFLPEVDREIDAVEGAVEAATLSAEAARSVVAGASTLGLDDEGVPSELYVDGRVELDTVAAARQDINEAELALTAALISLEGLDPRLEQLRSPIGEAHSRITTALARITDGRTLMDLLPSLFGAKEQRRFLLAFQAPGEARGTGGLVGLAAVLEADDGRLQLEEPLPFSEFAPQRGRAVEAPAWFRASYGPQQVLREWPQANVSPNHAVVSEVLLAMYEEGTGERLDGVLTMDPLALQELMAGADPIEIEDSPVAVDSANVAEVLLRDSYTEFETPEEQNAFLGAVVDGFWTQVTEGDIDLERFAEGLGNAIRGQHFKLYVSTSSDQRLIEDLELDGDYVVGPNSQMVFNVNYAANKVDYFLHRELDTEIELGAGGDATVTTTMHLENRAPNGPPSPLLGQDNGLDPGVNRMTINLLMPPGSVVDSFSVGGEERSPFTYTDEDSPVVWDLLEIPPGGTETVSLTYSMPNALQLLGEATTFDFSLYPQATVNPDTYSLRITPPPGVRVVDIDGPLSDEDVPSASGRLEEPVSVRLLMEEG